jgi:HTH-type transcriptional regulator, sugar sensing transcriptional regulator
MGLPDLELLEEIGLSLYERSALVTLLSLGVSDAATLCREGDIPSSKIYHAMEKLAALGLVRVQPTRPKQYAALPADVVVDRIVDIARERAERFARSTQDLRRTLASLPEKLRGRHTFVDLALGMESHARRHLVHLATATTRILSYMERGDLAAIDQAVTSGFPLLRRIARNAGERKIEHRVVFGFSYQSAPVLVEFLRRHRSEIRHLTGVRYSGELGHPFHVVDEATVVLPLDHPFVPEGRFASLLVHDRDLATSLTDGFEKLWHKAMRDLSEVGFHPVPHSP